MANNDMDYTYINSVISDGEEKNKERRKKRDWISRMPVILSLTSWALLAIVWTIIDRAAPKTSYILWESFFGANPPRTPWNRTLVNVAYIMLLVCIALCIFAFLCNIMRKRRKGDKLRISVFFVGGVTIAAFIAFLIHFIPMNIIGVW